MSSPRCEAIAYNKVDASPSNLCVQDLGFRVGFRVCVQGLGCGEVPECGECLNPKP